MSHATRPRREIQPASSTFHWLQRPDQSGEKGVLVINGTPYLLNPVKSDARFKKDRRVIGYRLTKAGGSVYDLFPRPHGWQCDCGDFVFNREQAPAPELRCCKHIRSLVGAISETALPIPQPIEPGEHLPDAPGCDGDSAAYNQ